MHQESIYHTPFSDRFLHDCLLQAGAAKPAAAAAAAAAPGGSDGGAAALYKEIEAQGNTVRDVKAKDPKSVSKLLLCFAK